MCGGRSTVFICRSEKYSDEKEDGVLDGCMQLGIIEC